MAARELTADDVAYTFNRGFAAPTVAGVYKWVSSVTATDKYTVVLGISDFNAIWPFYLMCGYFPGNTICPEWGDTKVGGGSEDWKNTVSDGPFIITDFTSGTGATYTKNPNYWGMTTINGKQYKMPFIDKLVYPIIPDESTAIAALRTAKIDWDYSVPTTYSASLDSTGILHSTWLTGKVDSFVVNRASNQYLQNKAVRQALIKATDFTTIKNLIYPGGNVFDWPAMTGDTAYVPLNQMPANIQDMWTYDAAKAKQMLAAAGYPNGFSLTITTNSTNSTQQDVAQLLVSQWAQVGITLTINAVDPTVVESNLDALKYDLIYFGMGPSNFINETNRVLSTAIGATYAASEPFDNLWWTMDREPDPTKRAADEKALSAAMLDDAGWIPMADPVALNYYWPWMKNYYQEIETGYENKLPMINRIWIDQSLKSSMGH
jgi:peptide/nickel transport system substrate-binding protein